MMEKVFELCPSCDEEVCINAEFVSQVCPNCGKTIVPCSMCEALSENKANCADCPLCK